MAGVGGLIYDKDAIYIQATERQKKNEVRHLVFSCLSVILKFSVYKSLNFGVSCCRKFKIQRDFQFPSNFDCKKTQGDGFIEELAQQTETLNERLKTTEISIFSGSTGYCSLSAFIANHLPPSSYLKVFQKIK